MFTFRALSVKSPRGGAMIVYDSHNACAFWRLTGSILPSAFMYALPSAALAAVLKVLEAKGFIDLASAAILNDTSVYSGFFFILSFTLAFRTGQSYTRYWTAATSVHEMQAEWFDACASLVAFVKNSKQPAEDCNRFVHTIVRLFSMLHAMALVEVASLHEESFPIIDIDAFNKEDLKILTSNMAQGRKTELVYMWVKMAILDAMHSNVLSVPAPILTRIFQEMGTGLVRYHDAVQVIIWPFPFPYAQLCHVLVTVHMFYTPLAFCAQTPEPSSCVLTVLISVLCIKALDLISTELENPCGWPHCGTMESPNGSQKE